MTEAIDLRTLPAANDFRLANELTGEKAGKRDGPWELLALGRSGVSVR